MKCPFCGSSEIKVIDKRESDEDTNRRRRECLSPKCGKRFTTYERVEMFEVTVVKKDGRREPFDRAKIQKGILRACEKRPISMERIQAAVDEIEAEVLSQEKPEVTSIQIGDIIIRKLKELDEIAYIRFASVYRQFKDLEQFENELKTLKVVKPDSENHSEHGSKHHSDSQGKTDTTDLSLMVATPLKGLMNEWDREKIKDALMKEINIPEKDAENISISVEKKVLKAGVKIITVSFIRELVNNELFEKGFTRKLEKQEILGISVYNLNQVIFSKNLENANIVSNNPEAVSLAISESVLKLYALKEVFSKDVAEAHLKGVIHLHDLGYVIRVYCSAHSPEYLKKFGLKLNNLTNTSKPAKRAITLTGHINTFLASMQAYYAGALGLAYLNIFYAPLIANLSASELKQEAQNLIFSCSQNAFSRGGQTLFIDFNIHTGIPKYLENIPAIGPGGKYMLKKAGSSDDKTNGKIEYIDDVPRNKDGDLEQPKDGSYILTYKDYKKEAQVFCKALMEVWHNGDSEGKAFAFPKMDLHLTADTFTDKSQVELLKYACKIATDNGSSHFIFDRDDLTLSTCCRLRNKIEDMNMIKHPESLRFCGFQNVTINLPQAAYRGKTYDGTVSEILKTIDLSMKAHLQKKAFIQKLMTSKGTPLWQVGMDSLDGKPYIDLEKSTYIIGMVGLNECVKYLTGKALHVSDDSYKMGLKIASAMYLKVQELEKQHGIKIVLQESPAEPASLRFAKVDLFEYPESREYVNGNLDKGEVYYTNSIDLEADADVDITERIEKQGKFNPIIESGAITHIFSNDKKPDAEAIFTLVKKTWENTQASQITISPEFTKDKNDSKISRGYNRD